MLAWVACGRLTCYWEPDLVRRFIIYFVLGENRCALSAVLLFVGMTRVEYHAYRRDRCRARQCMNTVKEKKSNR